MGESNIRRLFERLDQINARLSCLEGVVAALTRAAEKPQAEDKKWLQWLVGALIGIIGTLVGGLAR